GFHGLFNFCRVVPPDEIVELTRLFTPEIARSPQLLQLGRNCMAMGQWRAAAAIFQRILDVDPTHAEGTAALATASTNAATVPTAGRNDPCPCGSGKRYKHCHGAAGASAMVGASVASEDRLKQALALHQRGAPGDVAAAEATYRDVPAREPDHALAQHFLGVSHCQRGQFAEGWREYDARLALPELGRDRHRFPGPSWDGTAPAGKMLLLYPEQGLGDALQFARYATLLAEAGARCVIRCPDALAPLLATIPGVAEVSRDSEALPPYEANVPLLSLPRVLGTTAETIPASVPYIAISEVKRAAARATLAHAGAAPRVGLCWAGSAAHGNDRNRSLPLAALAPLLAVPGIAWFSLQQGKAAAQIAASPAADRLVPFPADAALVDTAALIADLDLIITVDTSIAHLAGALARPTWVLLPFAPDW